MYNKKLSWLDLGDTLPKVVQTICKKLSAGETVHVENSDYVLDETVDKDQLIKAFGLFQEIQGQLKSVHIKRGITKRINSGKHQGRVSGSKNKKHVLDGKEVEIFKLVSQGLSYNAIAKKLKVSTPTVIRCIKN